jgi:hypothetical protein
MCCCCVFSLVAHPEMCAVMQVPLTPGTAGIGENLRY